MAVNDPVQSIGTVSLDDLVESVIARSPEVALSQEDIEKAEREYKTAKTYYLPHISLQGSAGVDLFNIDEFDENNVGMNLILDWDFFRNGALIFRVAQARAKVEETKLKKYEIEVQIAMEVKQVFLDLIVLKEQLEIETIELDREKEKMKKMMLQLEQGEMKKTEVTRFKTSLFEKEQRLLKKRKEFEFKLFKFKRTSGFKDMQQIDCSYDTELSILNGFSLERCQSIAREKLPKNLINKMNYELSKKGARLARWKRWPQIDLFAGNAFAIDDFGQDSNQFEFRTGIIVRYPLYDGGEIKNQILLAELQEKRAKLAYEQGIEQIEDDIQEEHMKFHSSMALLEVASQHLEILENDKKQADFEFADGLVSKFDYDEILLNVRKAKLRQKSAYYDVLKACFELESTMGIKRISMDLKHDENIGVESSQE